MIDLSTTYLGLKLENPLVCSSSPLCEDLETLVRMEQAGAAAVVLHSLFEEQIEIESLDLSQGLDHGGESQPEATSYLPDLIAYNRGPDGYVEHLRQAKARLRIPVIASLNGFSRRGWTRYARLLADAGADALELNLYTLPTDPGEDAATVEHNYLELIRDVKASIGIPLAVKLSPFFTAPAAFAQAAGAAGAGALVLFNRFYQPDLDLHHLEVVPCLHLSTPSELSLRLHWTAILFGQTTADLAVTGGVHSGLDVLKVLMVGGRVAMLTSALLKHGVEHLGRVRHEMVTWMEEHDYHSVRQMIGSMSLQSAPNPESYVRANYMKVLRSYSRAAMSFD